MQPHKVNKNVGEQVIFHCAHKNKVKWYHVKTYGHASELVSNEYDLKIYPIQEKHSGYIYCFGQYPSNGKTKYFLSKAELKVHGKQ